MDLSYYECSRPPPRSRPYFVAAFPIDPGARLYDQTKSEIIQYLDVKAYVDTAAGCSAISSHLVKSIGLPIRRYKQPKIMPVPGGHIISLGTITSPFQYEGEQRWLSRKQTQQPRLKRLWLRKSWVPRRFWVDVAEFETPDDSDSNEAEVDHNWLQFDGVPPTKELLLEVIDDCPRPLILGADFIHKFEIFTKRRFHVLPADSPRSSRHGSRRSHRSRHSGSSGYSRGSRYSNGRPRRGWLHKIIDRHRNSISAYR